MSFNIAVQTAIFNALDGNISVPVYDDVPQKTQGWRNSYVTIGEDVFTDASTDTELMKRVSVTIHTWSRKCGRKDTKQIQDEIYTILNRAELTHAGFNFVTITEETAESQLDPDGRTRHGIQTFNLLIEEL